MTSAANDNGAATAQTNGSPAADPRRSERHTHIAIIGSGFSGIAAAVRFKRKGRSDFTIFEKANDVGGTWRDNTYPGIACDVPSNLYSFSFALNPDWSRSYSPGREIWDYLRGVARKFDVLQHIRFNAQITEARWDDSESIWRLQTSQGDFTADILIAGLGPLSEPQIPKLPGIERFKGQMFHSQQWDHGYDLTGKRVAVVGTGASAIQFVPQIQKQVAELHLYQRTPAWVMPRSERKITGFEHFLYKYIPFTQRIVRAAVYAMLELRVVAFIKQQWLMKLIEQIARLNIRRSISDPELRRKLTPTYTIGCKRILLANNYYPALGQPNVEVITSGVSELREGSVVASDGTEREVDAIIWGTGFHVTRNPAWDHIIGRDGRSLNETWSEGLQSYLGTQVANFPNMFLVIGPNTGLGHSSMVYMIEANVDYIERTIEFLESNDAGSVEVKQVAVDRFTEEIQQQMRKTVWTTGGCASWYLDEHGRNTTLWPDFTFRFRAANRDFDPHKLLVRDKVGVPMSPDIVAAGREPAAVA